MNIETEIDNLNDAGKRLEPIIYRSINLINKARANAARFNMGTNNEWWKGTDEYIKDAEAMLLTQEKARESLRGRKGMSDAMKSIIIGIVMFLLVLVFAAMLLPMFTKGEPKESGITVVERNGLFNIMNIYGCEYIAYNRGGISHLATCQAKVHFGAR